jgi:F-type H+-transporting ATPase subunit a
MLHIEIAAEPIAHILGFTVTNTYLMSTISVLFLVILALLFFRTASIIPGRIQNAFEILMDMILGMMEGVLGTRERAEQFFPLIATIFFFVLTSNWLGILPGIGSIGLNEIINGEAKFVPLFRSAASDINFTIALGVVTVLAINVFGIGAIGMIKHFSKFFSFKNPIDFFVGILEFISEIAKMISFSFRLFGNVFAGEVLLIIIGFLVPYVIPVPFLMLEIFVGFIQALVFAMLTMVFTSIAVSHD